MAVNCTKFLEAVQLDNSNAEQTFNILLSILKILNSSTEVSKNLPLYFRARLSVLYGYALSFEQCCFCNCKLVQHKSVGFKINTGQLACPYCINNFAKEWWIFSSSEFKHLKNVMLNSPENWPLKELSLSKLLKPIQAMDQFVQFHLGLIWKGNRFMQAA
jgi:DNA repair protein RecO (recombination protein O)